MPTYTTKRFSANVFSSCVFGGLLLFLSIWVISSFFPTNGITAYYQMIDPEEPSSGGDQALSVTVWAHLNHTLVVLDDNIVESIFVVTAKESPAWGNIIIKIDFDDPRTYTEDDPIPQILEGNQSWSGRYVDIEVNHTVTIYTKLRFDFDAKYCIRGPVLTCDSLGNTIEGYWTLYYVTVEQGKIVKITDRWDRTPPSTELELEREPQ